MKTRATIHARSVLPRFVRKATCGEKFGRSRVSVKHRASGHHAERRFPCVHCGKRFRQKAHLQKHVVSIHEKRKDYECGVCGRRFARKDVLVRHTRALHPEE
eukprot:Plantae.Rhodophyta-Rhodochaete_pulchella.ctg87676.p2 GENE.Plantae.Rhodophyta-Rhodochaete_pulchella.ctg87676~~Plantae.Rhodophyta-Rhodochaete_pulchella.ctg87676.p2  ORF type:complete len:102 (+),score=0.62 Plantae.Rhodophyta-Rhodochaete_pulchella.ctg87676:131-436(+)